MWASAAKRTTLPLCSLLCAKYSQLVRYNRTLFRLFPYNVIVALCLPVHILREPEITPLMRCEYLIK